MRWSIAAFFLLMPPTRASHRKHACGGLRFPVMQLRPQPSITRAPITGFTENTGPGGTTMVSVSFTDTLWRHPEDESDPRNEIELDDRTRRAIFQEPPPTRCSVMTPELAMPDGDQNGHVGHLLSTQPRPGTRTIVHTFRAS